MLNSREKESVRLALNMLESYDTRNCIYLIGVALRNCYSTIIGMNLHNSIFVQFLKYQLGVNNKQLSTGSDLYYIGELLRKIKNPEDTKTKEYLREQCRRLLTEAIYNQFRYDLDRFGFNFEVK